MRWVTGAIVRRFVDASGDPRPGELLDSLGLPPVAAGDERVEAARYYALLERIAAADDHGLPFRYARTVRPDDFGAMGLGMKTAPTLRGALERLVRYISVITDSLAYELVDEGTLVIHGRSVRERGERLANEAALAAVTACLRAIAVRHVDPVAVDLRHHPPDLAEHRVFFGCPVYAGADRDALHFAPETLTIATRLADDGLSAFLLARLDDLREAEADRPLEDRVRRVVGDSLCDGAVSKAVVARRLGMSERTLHRRLAERGASFRSVADQARRDAAESLLMGTRHSLAEVAFLTGFSDQTAFQRAFKRWTGQTPAAFRGA